MWMRRQLMNVFSQWAIFSARFRSDVAGLTIWDGWPCSGSIPVVGYLSSDVTIIESEIEIVIFLKIELNRYRYLAGICNWCWLTAILAKTTHCESSDSYIAHLTGTPAVWPSLAPNKIEIELTSNSSHHYIYLYRNQPPRSNQPGHPFVGRHCEYQPKAVMLHCWGV